MLYSRSVFIQEFLSRLGVNLDQIGEIGLK